MLLVLWQYTPKRRIHSLHLEVISLSSPSSLFPFLLSHMFHHLDLPAALVTVYFVGFLIYSYLFLQLSKLVPAYYQFSLQQQMRSERIQKRNPWNVDCRYFCIMLHSVLHKVKSSINACFMNEAPRSVLGKREFPFLPNVFYGQPDSLPIVYFHEYNWLWWPESYSYF